jgi:two-component system, LuxR family, response regulator FixJ
MIDSAPKPAVYVVDDDEPVRASLALQLSTAGFPVESFVLAHDFLDAAPTLGPGCVISDVRMPGMDGLELIRHLGERGLRFPVVIMTGHADVAIAVRAMKAGAVDFVVKPFSEETILAALALAQERLEQTRIETGTADAAHARLVLLSERERQVLEGLVAGLPNKTVAYDLGISPRTVEVHRAHIMDKMQCRSLSQLVRLALAAGIDIAS